MKPSTSPPFEPQPTSLTRRAFCAQTLGAGAMLPLLSMARSSSAAEPSATAAGKRKWEIFVIQHSHIDLGFTDRQEVIADYHRGFVRQAVAMAMDPAQHQRSEDCRFKYTIEGFWSLEQFLKSASASERRQLRRALKSGLIELTAGYFHMTELLDQEVLRSTFEPAQRFARREGLRLDACMSCDVNGFSWGFCELLAELGVRYLSTNINSHHGGAPAGGPLRPFYWESPTGRRVLVWNGLPYHRANVLGLMGYYNPDTELGFPGLDLPPRHTWEDVRDIGLAERKLLPALAHLESSGYPYDFLPVMGTALYTDNGPAGDRYCDILRQWNEKHGDRIHVRTATLEEFFRHLEQKVTEIPAYRGDWTDWWSDGVAATPLDTLLFRNAQRTRHLVRRLDPRGKVITAERLEAIDQRLALYAEHTFGYSDTSSHSLLTHQVFTRKTMHAVQADELAGQALVEVLRSRGEGEFAARRPFTYRVLNPLHRPVRAVVALPVDYWEEPVMKVGVRVVDTTGRQYPCQVESAPRGRVVMTQVDLPADGELELRIEPDAKAAAVPEIAGVFANAFYRAAWDEQRGWHSWVDVPSSRELLSVQGGGLGCPVYQVFPGGNRSGAAGFGYTARKIPRDEVTVGRCTRVRRVTAGPVFARWEWTYDVPGTAGCWATATFYHDLPQIELAVRVIKTDVSDPEGLYVLFPVELEGGVWHLDKPGGPIRPGLDQLPGSCCDYYCVQSGAALVAKDLGIAWTTLDAPLAHVGKMRLWNYSTSIEPTGRIYSWLTNNKWETNFKLYTGGRYEFRYVLQAGARLGDPKEAVAICQAQAMPPVVVRQ
ncbi:MAG: hypothetical protein IT581_21455 [Verrucomicrobiales bacterium]|nr:hypothetical protein [Verrucomicrobiales bacterium]